MKLTKREQELSIAQEQGRRDFDNSWDKGSFVKFVGKIILEQE